MEPIDGRAAASRVGRAGEIPSPYESSGIPDSVHNNYLAGCEQTAQTKAGCECLFDNLTTKQGIDTQEKLKALADKVKTATQSPNPAAAMPPEFRQAALACKASLVKTQ